MQKKHCIVVEGVVNQEVHRWLPVLSEALVRVGAQHILAPADLDYRKVRRNAMKHNADVTPRTDSNDHGAR